MGKPMQRPAELSSVTLKLRSPVLDNAVYLTLGLLDGRPVEVFINSKQMNQYEWISCVTRLLSSILRQPGPFPWYALDDMIDTFDPAGGYFVPGSDGVKVNGIVSHIGWRLKEYCKTLELE